MTDIPPIAGDFPVHVPLGPRWNDHDHYGHVNNAVYYEYFDSAVNGWLMSATGVDIREADAIAIVVSTSCRYWSEIRFPTPLVVGVRVDHVGTTSIRYGVALFRDESGRLEPAASGTFVHVYVDRETRRPTPVPDDVRQAAASARPHQEIR